MNAGFVHCNKAVIEVISAARIYVFGARARVSSGSPPLTNAVRDFRGRHGQKQAQHRLIRLARGAVIGAFLPSPKSVHPFFTS